MELPIVCTLTDTELKERRRKVLEPLRESAIDVTPTADGYLYRYQATSDALAQLFNVVDLERQCWQFLTFKVVAEAGIRLIGLEVSGPPNARTIIADYFGSAGPPVVLQSVITCPQCQHEQDETMPTDHCVFFYQCPNCSVRSAPRPGDCCVFCSYGSQKCPSVQKQMS